MKVLVLVACVCSVAGFGAFGGGQTSAPGTTLPPLSDGECYGHSDCADDEYCSAFTTLEGEDVVMCWPCLDSSGVSCEEWGDSVDGVCPAGCVVVDPPEGCTAHDQCDDTTYCDVYGNCWACDECSYWDDAIDGSCPDYCGAGGCQAHSDCGEGEYCSSYGNTCYPSYECEIYDDAIDGVCPDGAGYGGDGMTACVTHDDCEADNYCSDFDGTGTYVFCWPCIDDSGMSCSDWGDSVDESCAVCGTQKTRAANKKPKHHPKLKHFIHQH